MSAPGNVNPKFGAYSIDMILLLSAIVGWMVFYVTWNFPRLCPTAIKVLFSALYGISGGFITYAVSVYLFLGNYSANAPAGILEGLAAAERGILPAACLGIIILISALVMDLRQSRRRRLTVNRKE